MQLGKGSESDRVRVCVLTPIGSRNGDKEEGMTEIERIDNERRRCIGRREEKVEQRDAIGSAGWDGKVQGLAYALAILREAKANSPRRIGGRKRRGM